MSQAAPHMPSIAESYGINRAYVYELRERHGLTAEQLCDPDFLFQKLLESGRKCPLRSRLANPAARQLIREQIDMLAIRGPVPPIESKISSIK